jgi:hypothetical protein
MICKVPSRKEDMADLSALLTHATGDCIPSKRLRDALKTTKTNHVDVKILGFARISRTETQQNQRLILF